MSSGEQFHEGNVKKTFETFQKSVEHPRDPDVRNPILLVWRSFVSAGAVIFSGRKHCPAMPSASRFACAAEPGIFAGRRRVEMHASFARPAGLRQHSGDNREGNLKTKCKKTIGEIRGAPKSSRREESNLIRVAFVCP